MIYFVYISSLFLFHLLILGLAHVWKRKYYVKDLVALSNKENIILTLFSFLILLGVSIVFLLIDVRVLKNFSSNWDLIVFVLILYLICFFIVLFKLTSCGYLKGNVLLKSCIFFCKKIYITSNTTYYYTNYEFKVTVDNKTLVFSVRDYDNLKDFSEKVICFIESLKQ